MSPLHCPGQGLETDIIGSAVSAECDKLIVFLYFSFLFQHPVCRLHTGKGSPCIFKGIVDIAVLICRVGVHKSRDLQASRGIAHHSPVPLTERPQHPADRNGAAAACAHSVSRRQAFRLVHHFLKIICCFHPLLLHNEISWPARQLPIYSCRRLLTGCAALCIRTCPLSCALPQSAPASRKPGRNPPL